MNSTPKHKIAIITYDNISLFHLSIPCSIFGEDIERIGIKPYHVMVCAQNKGAVPTLSGFPITIEQDFTVLETADTIIIPGWYNPDTPVSQTLLTALRCAHNRGARMVGLCLGAFILAEAGILDGKTASTHWGWAKQFTQKYLAVTFNDNVLYIEEKNVFTSAGSAAAIDCCLHILRLDLGNDVASHIARRMVVAPHRSGGQVQFIEKPLPRDIDSNRLNPALSWASNNITQPLTLEQVASKANMSQRNFSRLLKKTMGLTFTYWLREQRLGLAQQLLETSDLNIDLVAAKAGFSSSVNFRQHFQAAFSISPSVYRKQFRFSD
ncbi:GlxA family transcriptional regulator [Pseudoalteromonas sp. ZZD1]|uniref:GlxA family transcriptional regulator n=1 Tax=Pseudoalteromonas sp. ZZD1 TaxID=3139395 RepID=UPI003BAC27CC